jgi:AAA family ATP:ADP antiporter
MTPFTSTDLPSVPPLRKALKTFLNIRREEIPFALNMFCLFFLITTSFWILKSLKKGLFFSLYKEQGGVTILSYHLTASQGELIAKVLNVAIALIAVAAFSWLSHHVKREKMVYIFTVFFMVCYFIFSKVLAGTGEYAVWAFYLFGDLFSTSMVAAFFAFLNDSVSPDAAKRLYGPIGLGGLLGGVCGSTLVSVGINVISLPGWMGICSINGVVIMLNAFVASRFSHAVKSSAALMPLAKSRFIKKHPAIDGAWIVFSSPYFFSIFAIVALYEIVSALMDFQFSATIEFYSSADGIGGRFAQVFAVSNWLSLFVQLFLTSFIMTRFGLTPALLTLPCAVIAGSLGFLAFPRPLFAGLLNTIDSAFSYSINQSAKEALYVPTHTDEKYKAKAFIDMFIQRFAKTIAIVASLIFTSLFAGFSTIRWMSLLTLATVLIWISRARYAGRAFSILAREGHL